MCQIIVCVMKNYDMFLFNKHLVWPELTQVVWKLWKLIDVFTCVAAVRDAKAEVKVKVLEKTALKVMPLNHSKAVNGTVTNRKLHTKIKKQNSLLAAFHPVSK